MIQFKLKELFGFGFRFREYFLEHLYKHWDGLYVVSDPEIAIVGYHYLIITVWAHELPYTLLSAVSDNLTFNFRIKNKVT
jgi:hypothetical protein